MKKQMISIIFALACIGLSGCAGAVSSTPTESTVSDTASSSASSVPVSSASKADFEGKVITYDAPNMTTQDWFSFDGIEGKTTRISLKVPEDWVFDSSIFLANDIKQAEMVGVIQLGEGQELPSGQILPADRSFDAYEPDEILSEETGTIAGLSYKLQKTMTYPDGGDIRVWYPYTYYLSDGNRVFVICFYSLKPNDAQDQALYESILSTFRYEE